MTQTGHIPKLKLSPDEVDEARFFFPSYESNFQEPNCSEAPFRRKFTIPRAMFEGRAVPKVGQNHGEGARCPSLPLCSPCRATSLPRVGLVSAGENRPGKDGTDCPLSPVLPLQRSRAGLGWAEPCWSLQGFVGGSLGWFGGLSPPAEAWRVLWAW